MLLVVLLVVLLDVLLVAMVILRERGPGVAMLLYSLLLTRGIAMVQRDADFPASLIAPNGYCAQELVNLLLVGRAHSNVFDGEKVVDTPLIAGLGPPPTTVGSAAASPFGGPLASAAAANDAGNAQLRLDNVGTWTTAKQLKGMLASASVAGVRKLKKLPKQDFAFVYFETSTQREAAEARLSGHPWKGGALAVRRAVPLDPYRHIKKQRVDEAVAHERKRVDAAASRVKRVARRRFVTRIIGRMLAVLYNAVGAHRFDNRCHIIHLLPG